jgi:outer membrane protein assembly factor BamB
VSCPCPPGRNRRAGLAALAACFIALAIPAAGNDWPLWRYDPARTANCTEQLPEAPRLEWVRRLPPQITAWKDEGVMRFDESYLPIVAGDLMFVGSTRSDSLTAYDVASGEERWRHYCDAPLRVAPAAWNGYVYVAADDGCLRCLSAADGKLKWKFDGAPRKRWLLGNERLISTWPARGGPVVEDRIVYFAVGVWPLMGTFVYALDAESGEVVWQNDSVSFTYRNLPHPGAEGYSGLAPQGHLVLAGDKLIVPGSRATPAKFDRRSGKFLGYLKGYGPTLAVQGNLLVASGEVYDIKTGDQIRHVNGRNGSSVFGRPVLAGSVWYSEAGLLAPQKIVSREIMLEIVKRDEEKDKRIDEDLPSYKEPSRDVRATGSTAALSLLLDPEPAKPTAKPAAKPATVQKVQARTMDRLGPLPGVPWLCAGSRLVTTTKGKVHLRDAPGGRVEVVRDSTVRLLDVAPDSGTLKELWCGTFDGVASEVLAAAGRLFLVTREGSIYCFGSRQGAPRVHELPTPPTPGPNPSSVAAEAILQATGPVEGFGLVWGLKDGNLVEALLRQSNLHVIAFDADPQKIEALRRRLDAAGWSGTRAAAVAADPMTIELAPYLASLIVSEDWQAVSPKPNAALLKKIAWPLRPYGGKACLPAVWQQEAETLLKEAALAGFQWKPLGVGGPSPPAPLPKGERGAIPSPLAPPGRGAGGEGMDARSVLERAGPLPGSAPWLGQNADAANTRCSRDRLVMAPLGVLWYGNALSNRLVLPRHGEGPVEQVVGGRLLIEGPDSLSAVDVYTGRLLWTRAFPSIGIYYNHTYHQLGAHSIGSNFYAVEDAIYVSRDESCLVLDPATGRTVREIRHPEVPLWQFLMVYDDLLIAGARPVMDGRRRSSYSPSSSKELVVMDRRSGKILWTKKAVESFRHFGICAGAKKLFCIDRLAPEGLFRKPRASDYARLHALDARTGNVVWDAESFVGEHLSYSEEHDVLLSHWSMSLGQAAVNDALPPTAAFRGADGKLLWSGPDLGASVWMGKWGMVLNGDTIYTQGRRAVDLLTGLERTWRDPTGAEQPWYCRRGHGCSPLAGSVNLLTFRSGCASFCDIAGDGGTGSLGGFRSGCTSNLIVADGVLNAPDYTRTCICAYDHRSSLALVPCEDVEYWTIGATPAPGRVAYNFGAPGDRRAPDGTLWLSAPAGTDHTYGKTTPVPTVPANPERFCYHSLRMSGDAGWKWVTASGLVGLRSAKVPLVGIDASKPLRIRLYFSEPECNSPGQRVFSVYAGERELVRDLDIAADCGGKLRSLVREVSGFLHDGTVGAVQPAATPYLAPGTKLEPQPLLELRFVPKVGEPVICGVEVIESGPTPSDAR